LGGQHTNEILSSIQKRLIEFLLSYVSIFVEVDTRHLAQQKKKEKEFTLGP
jgi:hypothetical protein